MPAGDRTGPMGMGPMTGRAAGACAGFGASGPANAAPGFGRGRGGNRGGGRGCRNMFHATGLTGWQRSAGAAPYAAPTRGQQLGVLKGQADTFEGVLGELRQRIAELEAVKVGK